MKRLSVLLSLSCLSLVACATKPDPMHLQQQVDNLDMAVISGQQDPTAALLAYETLANKYPEEPITVAAYSEALRRVGQSKESAETLRPMVKGQTAQTMAEPVFMAYMRLLLGQGFFADVQSRVEQRMALLKSSDQAVAAQLYNLLGVALAGQGKKEEAEQAFQQALKGWEGRPGVVEQNLSKLKAAKE